MADASVQSIRYTSPDTSMDWQTLANSFLTGMQARQKEEKAKKESEKEFQQKLMLSAFGNAMSTGALREANSGETGIKFGNQNLVYDPSAKPLDYGKMSEAIKYERLASDPTGDNEWAENAAKQAIGNKIQGWETMAAFTKDKATKKKFEDMISMAWAEFPRVVENYKRVRQQSRGEIIQNPGDGGGGKVTNMAEISSLASEQRVSIPAMIAKAKAMGYTISDEVVSPVVQKPGFLKTAGTNALNWLAANAEKNKQYFSTR